MSALAPRRFANRLTELAASAWRYGRPPAAAGTRPPRIVNADGDNGDRAEVFIYGLIGDDWFDDSITAASFVKQLRDIATPAIDLRINSPGGYVFDAVAIYTALIEHPATIDVHVDGIAASAASFVAMSGDSIEITKPARMMIHDARGIVIGNADDMRSYADLLDGVSDTIAEIYADRAGGTVADWREAMKATTWYTAAEAVDAGLADRVANDRTASTDSAGDDAGDDAPADRASQLIRARAHVALRG